MMKISLSILFSFFTLLAWAQEPQKGKILLTNQTVIEGVVDVNSFINSAVVTTEDGRQLTYHASMIDKIVTVDECDQVRQYQTFDYRSNSFFDRMEKKIFQLVEYGDITLLQRTFEYDVFDEEDEYRVEEWYYTTGEKVRRIKSFRRQILPLMADHAQEMKTFKKRNQLGNLNREANIYLMVSHYNTLSAVNSYQLTSSRQ